MWDGSLQHWHAVAGDREENPSNEGFVFSNYWNWNLLLESGEILKQKWHWTTKNGMLKLTYIKVLWKYLSSKSSTACHFRALKVLCTKNLNLTIRFEYNFSNQEMAFRLCTKQSSGGKNQEDKQLKLAPWLDKFALMETRQALETSCFESANQLLLRVEWTTVDIK